MNDSNMTNLFSRIISLFTCNEINRKNLKTFFLIKYSSVKYKNLNITLKN